MNYKIFEGSGKDGIISAEEFIFISQANGFGSILMEMVKDRVGHTAIYFGAQPGKEKFYERLGFQKGMQSYSGKFKK